MTEIFDIINKLGGLSFGALLAIALWASAKDYWCWSREREAMKAERDIIRAALEEDRNAWKRIALQHTGLIERAVQHASPSGSGNATR